jgi:hypothetical protein
MGMLNSVTNQDKMGRSSDSSWNRGPIEGTNFDIQGYESVEKRSAQTIWEQRWRMMARVTSPRGSLE